MINKDLIEKITNVDWSEFNGPASYDADAVPAAFYSLIALEDSAFSEEVGNQLINSLGNNHAGVYYPAVLKGADLIVEIIKLTDSKVCRVCALAVLNDLYYFEPDIGGYRACNAEELKNKVVEKLLPYSDDLIEF